MSTRRQYVLVTGGAGFIGTNLADRLLADGRRVLVFDNLGRPGVERNLRWLESTYPNVRTQIGDVRDPRALRAAVSGAEAVFHFAAQVAVTTSVAEPREDFDLNLGATVALLDELRRLRRPVPLLFTSTNKVYGTLPEVPLERDGDRWEPVDRGIRSSGIGEQQPLDFCTPYGCSKGGADQYVLDFAKTYGLPAAVFRMSCIYGRHQHGTEDQGWVAHFLLRALAGDPITIYGDGAQVRDVLDVRDLVEAMIHVNADAERLAGTAFNVGGGPTKTVSLLELVDLITELEGDVPDVEFGDERVGDQRWYVSDTSRLEAATGWRPSISVADGVAALHCWLLRRPASALAAARAS